MLTFTGGLILGYWAGLLFGMFAGWVTCNNKWKYERREENER